MRWISSRLQIHRNISFFPVTLNQYSLCWIHRADNCECRLSIILPNVVPLLLEIICCLSKSWSALFFDVLSIRPIKRSGLTSSAISHYKHHHLPLTVAMNRRIISSLLQFHSPKQITSASALSFFICLANLFSWNYGRWVPFSSALLSKMRILNLLIVPKSNEDSFGPYPQTAPHIICSCFHFRAWTWCYSNEQQIAYPAFSRDIVLVLAVILVLIMVVPWMRED